MSALHESLGRLLAGNQFVECPHGKDHGVGDFERALFKYAAATTKAVAIALQGAEYVTANEDLTADFSTEDAATVLGGLSALLDEAPNLLAEIRRNAPDALDQEAARAAGGAL